jgi:hypothetical protein
MTTDTKPQSNSSNLSIEGDNVRADKIKDKLTNAGDVSHTISVASDAGANAVTQQIMPSPRPSSVPPSLSLAIGREDDLRNLKARLGVGGETPLMVFTVIRGWPGIGKTTVAAVQA